jgi:carbon monoxide dehydrogenase subunit G
LEIRQSFRVAFAPEQVWRCFSDTESLVGCLPGASLAAPPSGGALMLSMAVKLGPIAANFTGQGQIALDDSTHSGRITGSGTDRKSGSRVRGEASFSLHDESADAVATRVDICIDYSMAGSLAQFSRGGIVRELAQRLTTQFGENLCSRLETRPAEPAPSTAAPLDLGAMFWPMLIARLQRWLRLTSKRPGDAQSRDD